jgi:hypothetical protein
MKDYLVLPVRERATSSTCHGAPSDDPLVFHISMFLVFRHHVELVLVFILAAVVVVAEGSEMNGNSTGLDKSALGVLFCL